MILKVGTFLVLYLQMRKNINQLIREELLGTFTS